MSSCNEEPCKSLREAYRDKAVRAAERAFQVSLACQLLKITRQQLRDAFLVWLVLVALALTCGRFGLLTDQLCFLIWALAMIVSAWLIMLYLLAMLLAARLRRQQLRCVLASQEETIARIDLMIGCPPECYPKFLDFKCGCD